MRVTNMALVDPAHGIKVTVFSLESHDSSIHTQAGRCYSRGIIRCAELCARGSCISFVCKFDYCSLYATSSNSTRNIYYKDLNVASQQKTKTTLKKPRLFMYPVREKSKLRIQQVNIEVHSTSYYPLSVRNINAVIYIPWTRQLLVASSDHAFVKAYPIFEEKAKVVLTGVSTSHFAVDEERQLVFIVTSRPNRTISRVTRNFSCIETVYKKKGVAVFDIRTHVREKRLIISSKQHKEYRLSSVSYYGKEETIISRGPKPITFCFDEERKTVYKSTSSWIRKVSLVDNSSSKMKNYGGIVLALLYYRDNIYIKLNLPAIRRYDLRTGNTGYFRNSYSLLTTNLLNFCVVY